MLAASTCDWYISNKRCILSSKWLADVQEVEHVEHIDGLMQERRNSIANALELGFSCTNPSIYF